MRGLAAEGFEMDLATNHLAPFLLARLLSDHLAASAPARIITVTSSVHSQVKHVDLDRLATDFSPTRTYAVTKLLNLVAMAELDRRLGGTGVTVNAADPGFVRTGLGRDATGAFGLFLWAVRPFQRTPERAAVLREVSVMASEPSSDDEPEDHWPYKDGQEPHPFHGDPVSTPDAEFIAHAREDIPYLVAELVGLRAQRDAALAMCQAARVAQSAPMWTPSRGAIAGFALNVEAALGVQPAPDKEQK